MTPSPAALALIKKFEGFAAHPYTCPAGKKTVGFGHVIRDGEKFQVPLSEDAAEALLTRDVQRFARGVDGAVRVRIEQCQFDALVSFAFNVGLGALLGSTLLRKLNAGDTAGAADEFLRWDKATNPRTGKKEPLAGLTRRRQAERDLFLRDGQ